MRNLLLAVIIIAALTSLSVGPALVAEKTSHQVARPKTKKPRVAPHSAKPASVSPRRRKPAPASAKPAFVAPPSPQTKGLPPAVARPTAFVPPASPFCQKDIDCPSPFPWIGKCNIRVSDTQGTCMLVPPAGPLCRKDSDCPPAPNPYCCKCEMGNGYNWGYCFVK